MKKHLILFILTIGFYACGQSNNPNNKEGEANKSTEPMEKMKSEDSTKSSSQNIDTTSSGKKGSY